MVITPFITFVGAHLVLITWFWCPYSTRKCPLNVEPFFVQPWDRNVDVVACHVGPNDFGDFGPELHHGVHPLSTYGSPWCCSCVRLSQVPLNVWYIYLHVRLVLGVNVGRYTIYIESALSRCTWFSFFLVSSFPPEKVVLKNQNQ